MGGADGIGERSEGHLGEAEGGAGGERSGFGGCNPQPSPGKNISIQGRSVRIPGGVELNDVLCITS